MDYFKVIDERLKKRYDNPNTLLEQIFNSVLKRNGKRLRPLLFLALSEDFALEINENILSIAESIEYFHLSSLIHDDLPAVDNDDYRDGSLTIHKIYGEGNALYAGIYLSYLGLDLISKVNLDIIPYALKALQGIIRGQLLDINEPLNKDISKYKTGELFAFVFSLPLLLNNNLEYLDVMADFGLKLGEYYQYQDDTFDKKKNDYQEIDLIFEYEKLTKDLIMKKVMKKNTNSLKILLQIVKRNY
ncbi:MAG: polyprenyl synthetase family protein [Bacillales bacterium]|jgi:geranylgeranyl diphosphate synthase type II|nr:polyprenyl synthetase family protein [Bacillales bacterium]